MEMIQNLRISMCLFLLENYRIIRFLVNKIKQESFQMIVSINVSDQRN
ncbi:hypothetical protein pb186bvf_016534 [Paramecium bursaria]